jgi:hypothetical protein
MYSISENHLNQQPKIHHTSHQIVTSHDGRRLNRSHIHISFQTSVISIQQPSPCQTITNSRHGQLSSHIIQ